MKIYTHIQSCNNNSYVGLELLNDKNQTYLITAFKTNTPDIDMSNILGIRRAIIFAKNNNVMYASNDIEVISNVPLSKEKNLLNNDECIRHILKQGQNIIYNEKLTDDDKYHLMCTQTQANILVSKDEISLLNKKCSNNKTY